MPALEGIAEIFGSVDGGAVYAIGGLLLLGLALRLFADRFGAGPARRGAGAEDAGGGGALAAISDPGLRVRPQPVWNAAEAQLFRELRCLVIESGGAAEGMTVHAQASLGAVFALSGPERLRFRAFRSLVPKRFDFLVVDAAGAPVLAVEYHGPGHVSRDWQRRDAIKRTICARASLPLVVVHHRADRQAALDEVMDLLCARLRAEAPETPGAPAESPAEQPWPELRAER